MAKNDDLDQGKTGQDSGSGFHDYDSNGAIKH